MLRIALSGAGSTLRKEYAMKIEVLGTGCYKCIQLETLLNEVVQELGAASIEIVRVAD